MPVSAEERFWKNVHKTDACWEWQAGRYPSGYGRFLSGVHRSAHRYAYALLVGPIPDGLQIDHLCRNPACVRPDHLEAVTPRENTLRSNGPAALNARKTHCPQGHPYDEANTMRSRGRRFCRICHRESRLRLEARNPGYYTAAARAARDSRAGRSQSSTGR